MMARMLRPSDLGLARALALVGLVALAGALNGCKAQSRPDPELLRYQSQVSELESELRDTRRELSTANDRLQNSKHRLQFAETRLGLRPFRARVLRDGSPHWQLNAREVTLLRRPGDRGQRVDLGRYARHFGGYVVAYWATWCKPCTTPEEIRNLEALQKELEAGGSALFGVAIDGLRKVQRHARANDWYYPIWQHKDAHIEWLPKAFIDKAGLGLPLFLVVDRVGRIRYWHNRPLDHDSIDELVTAALTARGRPSMR